MYFSKRLSKKLFSHNEKKGTHLLFRPHIFSPKFFALIAVYSLAFTLLLCGFRMLRLEQEAATSASHLTRVSTRLSSQNKLLQQSFSSGMISKEKQLQQNIASKIIRLHVIANSDSQSDQNLKLTVRDAVIHEMQSALKEVSSIKDARTILSKQMPLIQKKAQETIQSEGYDYPVSISLKKRYFPIKVYGDLTFPSGEYEALCLEIGKASGRNWWCVLFPSLCFVDETYAVVPNESKEKLQASLSEEEYISLENHRNSEEASNDEDRESESEKGCVKENEDSDGDSIEIDKKETKVQLRSGFLDWIMNR